MSTKLLIQGNNFVCTSNPKDPHDAIFFVESSMSELNEFLNSLPSWPPKPLCVFPNPTFQFSIGHNHGLDALLDCMSALRMGCTVMTDAVEVSHGSEVRGSEDRRTVGAKDC